MSLLNEEDPPEKPVVQAPEKYEDFKLPDGVTLEADTLAEAHTLFKSLNLDQAGAQSLVDFHTKALAKAGSDPVEAWNTMVDGWATELRADPEIGPKFKEVKADIGKGYAALIANAGEKGPEMAKTIEGFKEAMNLTGVGNHPNFVKVLHALMKPLVEPKHVSGQGPSGFGQGQNGSRPSPAQALYGNPKS